MITSAVSTTMIVTVDMLCAARRADAVPARTSVQMTGAVQTTRKCVKRMSQLRIQPLYLLLIPLKNQQRHLPQKLNTAVFAYLIAGQPPHQAINLHHNLLAFQLENQHHRHRFIRRDTQQAVQRPVPQVDQLHTLLQDHQPSPPRVQQIFLHYIQRPIPLIAPLMLQRPIPLPAPLIIQPVFRQDVQQIHPV